MHSVCLLELMEVVSSALHHFVVETALQTVLTVSAELHMKDGEDMANLALEEKKSVAAVSMVKKIINNDT